jgi:hypothetical protein
MRLGAAKPIVLVAGEPPFQLDRIDCLAAWLLARLHLTCQ